MIENSPASSSRKVFTPAPAGGHPALTLSMALAGALVIFLVLPLTNLFSDLQKKVRPLRDVEVFIPPPPPPPPAPPRRETPPPETPPTPKPEFQEPPPKLSLSQIELALNPGTGGALAGDFSLHFAGAPDAVAEMKIFELAEVDQAPEAVHRPAPVYPFALERARVSGTVVVKFVVDEQGRVLNPTVESSTHRDFEKPALEAARRSKFLPAIRNGAPVPTWVIAPYRFEASK